MIIMEGESDLIRLHIPVQSQRLGIVGDDKRGLELQTERGLG
jgi:hypothetical protein